MIFPIWQEIGQSTHMLAAACGKKFGEPATHTGTLDPMASGVVVILTGDDRFKKGKQTAWDKTYEFSIIWGIQTDSGDTLGCIQKKANVSPPPEKIAEVVNHFPQSYEQLQPDFSSRRYNGKSAFEWARSGITLPIKKRTVHVYSLITDFIELSDFELIAKKQSEDIQKILGNFRQNEIIQSWHDNHDAKKRQYLISHHTAVVSTGTYIRQLTQDIATKLSYCATTGSITRIKNGQFNKNDCITL